MNNTDRELLNTFAQRVKATFPGACIWAFGSRVTGTAQPGSDLDTCVVIDNVTPEARHKISDIAWEVGFNANTLISTVVFSARDFSGGPRSAAPLVQKIRREGVAA